MRTTARLAALLLCATLVTGVRPARADAPTRFDVNPFRPTPGPRDLIIIPQTQPLEPWSLALGSYFSFIFNPLALVNNQGSTFNLISSQLQWDLMAAFSFGIGSEYSVEVGAIMPIVLFQSGSLQAVGDSGSVQATVLGDLCLVVKLPIIMRRSSKKELLSYSQGLGLALSLRADLPTGSQANFASDGALDWLPSILLDYRFSNGALIGGQVGTYFRPSSNIPNLTLGPSLYGAIGAELPFVRSWGLTLLGGASIQIPVDPFPTSFKQCNANGLAGLRWYSGFGVTFTVGAGLDCHFSSNPLSFFLSAVWASDNESKQIEKFKKPPDDPDGDGVIGEQDLCPNVWGPVENHGCPELDTDKDGIPDKFDDCPNLPGIAKYNGCPRIYASENKIRVMESVLFATDQEVILPESFELLEDVASLMREHSEWLQILVEGHADIRASDLYNMELSQRRAESVRRFLVAHGVEPSRLRAEGFGKRRPIADNRTEEGMALNRRVTYTIEKVAPTAPKAPAPAPKAPGPAASAPAKRATDHR